MTSDNINIIYFGTACSTSFEEEITKVTEATYSVAQNNLERALLNGFAKNGIENINLHCLPVLQYDILSRSKLYRSEKVFVNNTYSTKTFTILKIKFIKELLVFLSTVLRVIKWAINQRKVDKRFAFIAINYLPVSVPIVILSKLMKFECVAMICDLSRNTYTEARGRSKKLLNNYLFKQYLKITQFIEKSFDRYVFLTLPMNLFINTNKKPFVVVEGIYNDDLDIEVKTSRSDKKVIVYSGGLFEDYGIDTLITAFNLIEDRDFELHIYGSGPMEEEIKRLSIVNPRVKFYGFVQREQLFERLKSAWLLVNIRNPHHEYTRFSFPSKTFEYMVTGVPVLSTKLEGIPNDYYKYLFIVDEYNAESIANQIRNVCDLSDHVKAEITSAGRDFILNSKTCEHQVRKIIELLKA